MFIFVIHSKFGSDVIKLLNVMKILDYGCVRLHFVLYYINYIV